MEFPPKNDKNDEKNIVKIEKMNLTFGVFGVIPSYLVRIEHIWREKIEKYLFGENIFFSIENQDFEKIFFFPSEFWKILNFEIENLENIFSKSWFSIEKRFFIKNDFFHYFLFKYAPSSPNMKV